MVDGSDFKSPGQLGTHVARGQGLISALALAAAVSVALLLRLVYHTKSLNEWDSVNFALSLVHFDVRAKQPHPPGQLLYVVIGNSNGITGTRHHTQMAPRVALVTGANRGIGLEVCRQ